VLEIGSKVPDFELANQEGKPIRLSDYRGRKVIVFAFPKANTAGCNAQACAFRDEFPQVTSAHAVVLGISGDSVETLRDWKADKHLPYDLLSDPEHQVLEPWGAWGIPMLGLIRIPMVNRSYWVIDENGVLIDQQINVDPKDSVKKALAAVGETVAEAGD
jgi:peroxiredoxin Q/BCP